MAENRNLAIRCEVLGRNKLDLLQGQVVGPIPKNMRDYELALHMAGVTVVDHKRFGSYQGDWWALVRFPNGEEYFVSGGYGSCSGCDPFEAKFDWGAEKKDDYAQRLADFGRGYLDDCYTLEQAIEKASENLSWDIDAEVMVNWLKIFRNRIEMLSPTTGAAHD